MSNATTSDEQDLDLDANSESVTPGRFCVLAVPFIGYLL